MPDWQKLVRERLGALGISPQRDDEIADELAGYLEDRAADTIYADLSQEVSDWQNLRRNLRDANLEGDMNRFTRSFWLGMILLLPTVIIFSLAVLNIEPDIGYAWTSPDDRLSRLGPKVMFLNEKQSQIMYVFVPWLSVLPLIGAGAALWARRFGAPARQRLLISVFPAVVMFGILSIGIPGQLVVNPSAFATFVGGIVAVCLLLTALPFLRSGPPATDS